MGPAREELDRERVAAEQNDRADAVFAEMLARGSGTPEQLASYAETVTQALWAAMLAEDVHRLDAVVHALLNGIRSATHGLRNLFPVVHPDLLDAVSLVATCHLERFPYRLELSDLDEAERYALQILELADGAELPAPVRVRVHTVLGQVAVHRYEFDGDANRIAEALPGLRDCVANTPDVLAMAVLARCLRLSASPEDPAAAEYALQQALWLTDQLLAAADTLPPIPVLPLLRAEWIAEQGLVHLRAYQLWGRDGDLHRARELTGDALREGPTTPAVLLAAADAEPSAAAYRRAMHGSARGNSWAFLRAAEGLTWALYEESDQQGVYDAGGTALRHLHHTIERQADDAHKGVFLTRIAAMIALVAPARADSAEGVRNAVEQVERSRTRVLAERFAHDEPELQQLTAAGHDALARSIRGALRAMRNGDASPMTRHRGRDELMWYQQQARELPGFARFRDSPDFVELTADLRAPLVYLVPGIPTGVALFAFPDGDTAAIPLPACTSEPVPDVVHRFQTAIWDPDLPAGVRRIAVDEITTWAWDALFAPLRALLAESAYVHLVGVGYLAGIPMHAARTPTDGGWRYALGDADLRYAPSGRSLALATARLQPEHQPRMLVVPQAAGAGRDLQYARREADAVAGFFPEPIRLATDEVTRAGIAHAIAYSGLLHASCHGTADPADPMAGGLILGGGARFSVRDLFDSTSGHLMAAVLSACQTNLPDPELPDEATSLAAGLLIGGCRAVVASAWQVPQTATYALMTLLYHHWQTDGLPLPEALRRAQLTFAEGDAGVPDWQPRWSQPYYWAGFSYLGA